MKTNFNKNIVDNFVPPMKVISDNSSNHVFWKGTAIVLLISIVFANGYSIYVNHLQIKRMKEEAKNNLNKNNNS